MSRFRLPSGDDHPDAAQKHLVDAETLLDRSRSDGAGYLSGYVVETALKSLYFLETGQELRGHKLPTLVAQVSAVASFAGAKTAKYFGTSTRGVPTSAIKGWTPEMRYRSPFLSLVEAHSWYACAGDVFRETVHEMRLDGVL